eukprot:1152903-Pelagomonas_calceolata.AAC.6
MKRDKVQGITSRLTHSMPPLGSDQHMPHSKQAYRMTVMQATCGSAEPDGATEWSVGHRHFLNAFFT